MKKLAKSIYFCCLISLNILAGDYKPVLENSQKVALIGLTGAGYLSCRLAKNWQNKQKREANKTALVHEIISRVTEIRGKPYQLTVEDNQILDNKNLKLLVLRGSEEEKIGRWQNVENGDRSIIMHQPNAFMIYANPANYKLWHNCGPNFTCYPENYFGSYTRTFNQDFEEINYQGGIDSELKTLLSSQPTTQKLTKINCLQHNSSNSAFSKFIKA